MSKLYDQENRIFVFAVKNYFLEYNTGPNLSALMLSLLFPTKMRPSVNVKIYWGDVAAAAFFAVAGVQLPEASCI